MRRQLSISIHQSPGRRPAQEDRYVSVGVGEGHLLAVFDGHGGAAVSAEAALMMPRLLNECLVSGDATEDALRHCIAQLSGRVAENAGEASGSRAGSTLSAAYVTDQAVHVAVLGDSPLCLRHGQLGYRAPEHRVLDDAPDVQRLRTEYAEAIAQGRLGIRGGYLEVNWMQLAMTRALGDPEFDPYLCREPDIASFMLEEDEPLVLLIASDGIGNDETELARCLERIAKGETADQIVRHRLDDIQDNLTVLAAVLGPSATPRLADMGLRGGW